MWEKRPTAYINNGRDMTIDDLETYVKEVSGMTISEILHVKRGEKTFRNVT